MTSNGYTARVARVIAASTGADVFEVETAEPYPAGYSKTTDVVQDEFDRKIYRVLKKPLPVLHDILKYPPNDINFDPPRGGVVRYFYNDEKVEDHGFRCSSQRRFQNHDYQRMPSSCAATCS